jgi:hypothetical protein
VMMMVIPAARCEVKKKPRRMHKTWYIFRKYSGQPLRFVGPHQGSSIIKKNCHIVGFLVYSVAPSGTPTRDSRERDEKESLSHGGADFERPEKRDIHDYA